MEKYKTPCPDCKGSCMVGFYDCDTCQGTGSVDLFCGTISPEEVAHDILNPQSEICPRCNGTGDDSFRVFTKHELDKYTSLSPHLCGLCSGTGEYRASR